MSNKTKWNIDPIHSEIGFKVRHLMITNVKGFFKEYEASIVTTGDDFMTSEVDFWMNSASIDTGSPDRDKHIKSPDFLDVEHFKQINFLGNTYEQVDNDGSYELYGDLTIKGITKRIKLDVEFGGVMRDPWGTVKAGITINGKINRKDWNLNWNAALETGGVLVSDEVAISCDIQLVKSPEEVVTADEVVVIPELRKV
ncbi:MAG: polyisoprenoid-binding protein [Saprospiraceae bacterium]|uniref:Polyisoprenoid-binding protein n=1 Tax=Candidatus Opimibacter skivensis TaxID=2982028 RepID=A0A9D7SQM8_9BACT|nr:polyisoprenoid-binding protein [Candidatus Opimibacter skivensis]